MTPTMLKNRRAWLMYSKTYTGLLNSINDTCNTRIQVADDGMYICLSVERLLLPPP
jgi:hypothetical protein